MRQFKAGEIVLVREKQWQFGEVIKNKSKSFWEASVKLKDGRKNTRCLTWHSFGKWGVKVSTFFCNFRHSYLSG